MKVGKARKWVGMNKKGYPKKLRPVIANYQHAINRSTLRMKISP
jgi:hypothetical protein